MNDLDLCLEVVSRSRDLERNRLETAQNAARASKFLCQYKKSGLPNSNQPSNFRPEVVLPVFSEHVQKHHA